MDLFRGSAKLSVFVLSRSDMAESVVSTLKKE